MSELKTMTLADIPEDILKLIAHMEKLGFSDLQDFGLSVEASSPPPLLSYSYKGHQEYYDQCAKHKAFPQGHVIRSSSSGMLLFTVVLSSLAHFVGLSPGHYVSNTYIDKFYDEDAPLHVFSVEEVIKMLDLFHEHYFLRLQKAGIETTASNILKFWTLEQHADSPVGFWRDSPALKGTEKNDRIIELIKADIDIYLAFHALSNYANPEWENTGEFQYSIVALEALRDMPRDYLDYMFFPKKA